MVIIDECHIGNFKKMFEYFSEQIIIGFSATPISGSKKTPLNDYYTDIISTVSIRELIENGSLCPNITYSIKGVNRGQLKVKNGEFDFAEMSKKYTKNVSNTLTAYRKYCDGQKTMIFNCNVEHNSKVNDVFLQAGYPSRIIIGDTDNRDEIYEWFRNTDGAILQNVGVLTTGFDEPSVRNVIINRSTLSLSLWLQMTGRGARTNIGKDHFKIIDMGGNATYFGDWSHDHNWKFIFENPEKWREGSGVPPVKECKRCERLIHASVRICSHCGYDHKQDEKFDTVAMDFERIISNIDLVKIKQESEERGHKEFAQFFKILNHNVTVIKNNKVSIEKGWELFESNIKKWCDLSGRKYDKKMKQFAYSNYHMKVNKVRI
jgi:superfamily II DNA or RNA helicase